MKKTVDVVLALGLVNNKVESDVDFAIMDRARQIDNLMRALTKDAEWLAGRYAELAENVTEGRRYLTDPASCSVLRDIGTNLALLDAARDVLVQIVRLTKGDVLAAKLAAEVVS